MDERALKEVFFNERTVGALAAAAAQASPGFDPEAFTARVFDDAWPARALKQRIRHLSTTLHAFLPAGYREALAVLDRMLPLLAGQTFEKMVFPDYVEVYGLDDWEASMAALEHFTQHVSAEFAIRPFLAREPERTLAQLAAWAAHPHEGVRRLASEGSRPRLPWAMRLPALQADPTPLLPILERLRDDPSESVRRSVANHLNDLSKDHPALVLGVLRAWLPGAGADRQRVVRHALRTLVKQGDLEALRLLGASDAPAVAVRDVVVTPPVVPFGGTATFSFVLESQGDAVQDVVVDYVVDYVKAHGRHAPKVFKLTRRLLQPGEAVVFTRRLSFRPLTTRTYYPGEHAVTPQVNGQRFDRAVFVLRAPDLEPR